MVGGVGDEVVAGARVVAEPVPQDVHVLADAVQSQSHRGGDFLGGGAVLGGQVGHDLGVVGPAFGGGCGVSAGSDAEA